MKKKPLIIGICGPSAAGKSYLADYIFNYYKGRVSIVSYDSYCKGYKLDGTIDPDTINFDAPDIYDGELLAKDIAKAREGEDINAPIYDFVTHSRKKETHFIPNNAIIIVEGILIYQVKELIPLLDIKVFITANKELRFVRRSERDINERGRTLASVKEQWNLTVEPSRHLYIDNTKEIADVVIHNTGNNGIEEKAKHLISVIDSRLSKAN